MEGNLFKLYQKFIRNSQNKNDKEIYQQFQHSLAEALLIESESNCLKQNLDKFLNEYKFEQDEQMMIRFIKLMLKQNLLIQSDFEKYTMLIKKRYYINLSEQIQIQEKATLLKYLKNQLLRFYPIYSKDSPGLFSNAEKDIQFLMQLDTQLNEKLKKVCKYVSATLAHFENVSQKQQQILHVKEQQNIDEMKEQNMEEENKEDLETILRQIYEQQNLSKQNKEILIEQEVSFIQKMICEMNLKKMFGFQNVYVQPFGSLVSGFSLNRSDIDISINTDCYLDERAFLSLLFLFMKNYLNKKGVKYEQLELKTDARIPLITFIKKNENLDLDDKNLSIDICVNNLLGCANSKMLETISKAYPQVCELGIIIKYWAKQQGLISKKNLSSYAFILIMISFLQKKKFIDSYFQDRTQKKKNDKKYETTIKRIKETDEEFKTNLYFIRDSASLLKQLKKFQEQNPKQKTVLNMKLSSLFIEFISYYSDISNKNRRYIDIINDYVLKQYDKKLFFYINDPLDKYHNPGERSKVEDIENNIYINTFRFTEQLLKEKKYSQIFESMFKSK